MQELALETQQRQWGHCGGVASSARASAVTVFLRVFTRRPLTAPRAPHAPPQGHSTRADGTTFVHKYLHSGNFLLKHTSRTKNLMEMWRVGYEFQVREVRLPVLPGELGGPASLCCLCSSG